MGARERGNGLTDELFCPISFVLITSWKQKGTSSPGALDATFSAHSSLTTGIRPPTASTSSTMRTATSSTRTRPWVCIPSERDHPGSKICLFGLQPLATSS